jgi:uncharacterized membrane protein
MASIPGGGLGLPQWVLWARLPLQAVLLAWVWAYTRQRKA